MTKEKNIQEPEDKKAGDDTKTADAKKTGDDAKKPKVDVSKAPTAGKSEEDEGDTFEDVFGMK